MKRGDSTIDIMLQRERLLARCASQREELAVLVRQLNGPLKVADHGVAGLRYLRAHPMLLAVATALLAAVRPRGALKWVQRGFVAWRAYRAFGQSNFKSLF